MRRQYATVKVRLDENGNGSVVVNGVEMGGMIRGTTIAAAAGEPTIVTVDIYASDLEFESNDEVKVLINHLTPADEPLAHKFLVSEVFGPMMSDVCVVCRQVRRVAASVCSGPMKGV